MPLEQGTFKIVPTSLVANVQARPPMTSKQAKKAYKKATAAPKLSKWEQRKQEEAEIKAIRDEQEKERTRARGRAAREKKAEKERLEREERRKNRVPEKSKWVRPSQPTITGLMVRTPRSDTSVNVEEPKHKLSSVNEIEEEEDQMDEPPSKRRAITPEGVSVLEDIPRPFVNETSHAMAEDDEFGDFPPLTQSDMPLLTQTLLETSHELPSLRSTQSVHSVDDDVTSAMVDSQILSETLEAEKKSSPTCNRNASPEPDSVANGRIVASPQFKKPDLPLNKPKADFSAPLLQSSKSRRPLQQIASNRRSMMPVGHFKANSFPSHDAPSSTMAFLEAHLDDFFPSPSQEVREIMTEMHGYDMPSNTQIALEIDDDEAPLPTKLSVMHSAYKAFTGPSKPIVDHDFCFLSTQDFVISSQDFKDMDTPSKVPPRRINSSLKPSSMRPSWSRAKDTSLSPIRGVGRDNFAQKDISKSDRHGRDIAPIVDLKPRARDPVASYVGSSRPQVLVSEPRPIAPPLVINEADFDADEEFCLSTQDMRDIDGAAETLVSDVEALPRNTISQPVQPSSPKQQNPIVQKNGHNTRAIPSLSIEQELATTSIMQPHTSNRVTGESQPKSPRLTRRRPFFEEKEEDILAAVLEESLKTAAAAVSRASTGDTPRCLDRKTSNGSTQVRRKFVRVISVTQSDYGELGLDDDDLSALIEQAENSCEGSSGKGIV